tara:strand:+ start:4550 stop:4993 length:444 start_codon:yes stop_codon:yes gene_type:complete
MSPKNVSDYRSMIDSEFKGLTSIIKTELNSCIRKTSPGLREDYLVKVNFYEKGFIFKDFIIEASITNPKTRELLLKTCSKKLALLAPEVREYLRKTKFVSLLYIGRKKGCAPWLEGRGFPIKSFKNVHPDKGACPVWTKEKLEDIAG